MKTIGIIALTVMITIPSSSFAWGPTRGGVRVVQPFVPRVIIGRGFIRPPFVIFPNRVFIRRPFAIFPNRVFIKRPFVIFPNPVFIQQPLFFPLGWSGSYYSPNSWFPPYAYHPSDPYNGYTPVPPPAPDTTYDWGYSEGYSRGYEQAQKDLGLEKTPGDEHEKSGAEGNQ